MELLEREGPLEALAQALEDAREGRGSTVLVTGEPGIGKSALVSQFMRDHGERARFLTGTCDDLSVPRPLGPLRDLALTGELADALRSEAPPHRIHALLLDLLAERPRPTVLILEDVHWADDATIDVITVIGRRIARLPALLVLTYRSGEVEPGDPLATALDAIRGGTSVYLRPAPLSRSAVTTLARGRGDAEQIFAATGGNPFYVGELIRSSPGAVPPSVAGAVVGRASRLPESSRRLVELVAMVPTRMPTWILDAIMPEWAEAAEEPERRELLSVEPGSVRFRHELARTAIRSSVPGARRRGLHEDILRALVDGGADPAEIVHHAAEAGNVDALVAYTPVAARRATSAASYREAYSHLHLAVEFADRYPPGERGALLEEFAWTAYVVGRLEEALDAIDLAVAIADESGDRMALGRTTRIRSRLHWYAGDGSAAWREAESAVQVLEPLGPSVELARAYSGLAQLAMLSAHDEEALEWGRRALELAVPLGADDVRAHALVSMGVVRMQRSVDDTAALLEGVEAGMAAGEHHEVVRGLLGLAYTDLQAMRPAASLEFCERGRRYAETHQVDTLLAYLNVILAWLRLRAGDWEEAEHLALVELDTGASVSRLLAQTVLTELAVRRGDSDAAERLTAAADAAERTGEIQRLGPVFELQVERALTGGGPMPAARLARLIEVAGAESLRSGPEAARVAAWAAVAGERLAFDGEAPPAYAAMMAGDYATAARHFGAAGWTYDEALMRSLLDDEASLTEALRTARALSAEPLERRVLARMREAGLPIPRAPKAAPSADPAGLTPRQLEVLGLLADGSTNAEIAERLFLSPRTVEHHVEAILGKLGVSSRREAARLAGEHPMTGGSPA
ncbi:LuxR family transcriptional regulator [Agromyces sp. H66]|uniref:ATP-binding protein n=1 Tax=Agromyces sp. H66 TaxID=2529859 RepID=UPI0010AA6E10|nr:LuxR family transcriptional regulator [Agromyces sp. H66]